MVVPVFTANAGKVPDSRATTAQVKIRLTQFSRNVGHTRSTQFHPLHIRSMHTRLKYAFPMHTSPLRTCGLLRDLRVRLIALPALLLIAGTAQSAPPDWKLRFDGAGPLRIGMSFEQARTALGGQLEATPPELQASPGCDRIEHLTPDGGTVMLMFHDGVLDRVDEWKPGHQTDRGVAVGATETQVRARYPSARRERHAYDDEGAYLTVRDDKRKLWLRFELSKGRVTQFYAGRPDAVQATEGCL